MRCLMVMHSFGGGAENLVLTLARHFCPKRIACTIACSKYIPELKAQVPSHIPFYAPARPGLFAFLVNLFHLYRCSKKYDVVLGTLELQSIFLAVLLAGNSTVGWLHKDIAAYLVTKSFAYATVYKALLGWALQRCRAVACVSEGVCDSTLKLWPALRDKVCLLNNPVDIEDLQTRGKQPLQPELADIFTRPVVLAVGRLAQQKAFQVLIEAHALLVQRGVAQNLCILGEGPERIRLAQVIKEFKVEKTVFMPGAMDPCPAMRQAEVLALSSIFEGFGLVIVEALAQGTPVVATDCPSGPREILQGGKYGKLVPMCDAEALAAALEEILLNAPVQHLKEAGEQRAADFDLAPTLLVWEDLLLACAEG